MKTEELHVPQWHVPIGSQTDQKPKGNEDSSHRTLMSRWVMVSQTDQKPKGNEDKVYLNVFLALRIWSQTDQKPKGNEDPAACAATSCAVNSVPNRPKAERQ